MKILAVSDFFPWPTTKGGLIRTATAVGALSKLGELDLFSFYDTRLPAVDVPADVRLTGLATTPYPRPSWSRRWQARAVLQRGVPHRIALRTYDPQQREDFDAFAADRYDLVWFSTAATYEWLGRPDLGPTVVDFIDLEDEKERQRAGTSGAYGPAGVSSARARLRASAASRINAHDWRRFQVDVADHVDRVVLCSDADVRRLGVDNAVVVPNTYPEPARAVGKAEAVDPPTLLLQATFDYAPNVDAAQWLVREVAPKVRARLPGARVRLAGLATPQVEELADPPNVTVTGFVPDMADELARADIVVVPLRIGSGTRLKILESFAHRVPVVSTTLGAEGLDVVDGEHLLLADTPEAIAAACAMLQDDPELRRRLVDAAQDRYRQTYAATAAHERIRLLVDSVVRPGERSR